MPERSPWGSLIGHTALVAVRPCHSLVQIEAGQTVDRRSVLEATQAKQAASRIRPDCRRRCRVVENNLGSFGAPRKDAHVRSSIRGAGPTYSSTTE